MTPEAKTKNEVRKILDAEGVYHFMPFGGGYGRAGIPDIVGCVNGLYFGIECKAGKGKPTALQQRELQRIQEAGGAVFVVWDNKAHMDALRVRLRLMKIRVYT